MQASVPLSKISAMTLRTSEYNCQNFSLPLMGDSCNPLLASGLLDVTITYSSSSSHTQSQSQGQRSSTTNRKPTIVNQSTYPSTCTRRVAFKPNLCSPVAMTTCPTGNYPTTTCPPLVLPCMSRQAMMSMTDDVGVVRADPMAAYAAAAADACYLSLLPEQMEPIQITVERGVHTG